MTKRKQLTYIRTESPNPQRNSRSELGLIRNKWKNKIKIIPAQTDLADLMSKIAKLWQKLTPTERFLLCALLVLLVTGSILMLSNRSSRNYSDNNKDGLAKCTGHMLFKSSQAVTIGSSSRGDSLALPYLGSALDNLKQEDKTPSQNDGKDVVCDNNNVCNTAKTTDDKKSDISSGNPLEKNDDLFYAKCMSRIELTEYAQNYANHSASVMFGFKELIIQALQYLTKINARMKCKVLTLFENTDLKLNLTTTSDPAAGGLEYGARYFRHSNTIVMYTTVFDDNYYSLPYFLYHEMQHALANYENKRNGYLFFTSTKEWEHTSTPCFPNLDGTADCSVLSKILDYGLQQVHALINYFKNPTVALNKLEEHFKKQYLKAIKNYKSIKMRQEAEPDYIQYLKNKNFIDDNLNIITPSGIVRVGVERQNSYDSTRIGHNYMFKFEKVNNKYYLNFYIATDNSNQAPLRDLLYLLDTYEPMIKADGFAKYREYDAVIHQVLEPYPRLMDLLFPGLYHYHSQRAGAEYQKCMLTNS